MARVRFPIWNRNTFAVAVCVHIILQQYAHNVRHRYALYETVFRLIRSSMFTTCSMARAGLSRRGAGTLPGGPVSVRAALAAAEAVVFHKY